MSDDFRAPHLRQVDFVGAFGVLRRADAMLFVRNTRTIGGRAVATWDLPGGQVEPGELGEEALARELREELQIDVATAPRFLFVQEGSRGRGGRRVHAWRSFFFAVDEWHGTPQASGEVEEARWLDPEEQRRLLTAPYHDSFLAWIANGGTFFRSRWEDP
jgi:ADP-ribose pyrophosphatase YjhB (NUDIX family)